MGLTKWVWSSGALLKLINTASLGACTRINSAQHRADNRVFSQFPLFSPQMSHPFDNLRIFILRKTADYKSIIITVELGQDQGAHFRFFGVDAMRRVLFDYEMRTRQFFPIASYFIWTIFNWMIMASVRDYLSTSHLNTTGSYFCFYFCPFFSLRFIVDKNTKSSLYKSICRLLAMSTITHSRIKNKFQFSAESICEGRISFVCSAASAAVVKRVCTLQKSPERNMSAGENRHSLCRGLEHVEEMKWYRKKKRDSTTTSKSSQSSRDPTEYKILRCAPCDRREIKLDSRLRRYVHMQQINLFFPPRRQPHAVCLHSVLHHWLLLRRRLRNYFQKRIIAIAAIG